MLNSQISKTRSVTLVESVPYRGTEVKRHRRLESIKEATRVVDFNTQMNLFLRSTSEKVFHYSDNLTAGGSMSLSEVIELNGM